MHINLPSLASAAIYFMSLLLLLLKWRTLDFGFLLVLQPVTFLIPLFRIVGTSTKKCAVERISTKVTLIPTPHALFQEFPNEPL